MEREERRLIGNDAAHLGSDVLVHIFLPDTRQYYNLENLWEDAILTKIPNEE